MATPEPKVVLATVIAEAARAISIFTIDGNNPKRIVTAIKEDLALAFLFFIVMIFPLTLLIHREYFLFLRAAVTFAIAKK